MNQKEPMEKAAKEPEEVRKAKEKAMRLHTFSTIGRWRFLPLGPMGFSFSSRGCGSSTSWCSYKWAYCFRLFSSMFYKCNTLSLISCVRP